MEAHKVEKEFENLIREHELLITKVCRMYAYTASDRQDLFQDIVVQLWRSYPRFKGESKVSTWLYRVAINTSISGLRGKKDFVSSYEPSALPHNVPDVNTNAVAEEQLQHLHTAISQLNEIEKAIVMLYLEDRSYDEMEAILGINQGNLRVKMNRIKDKLRQLTKNK